MTPIAATIALLSATLAVAGVMVVYFWPRDQGLALRRIVIVVYAVVYPVSGLAHVLGFSVHRGFYEASAGAVVTDRSGLVAAALCSLVGLIALVLGLLAVPNRGRHADVEHEVKRASPRHSLVASHPVAALVAGAALSAVSVFALLKVRTVVAALDGARVIAVDGGMARFASLAQWLPWGCAIAALALLVRRPRRLGEVWNAVLMVLVIGAGYLSTSWSGGRTDIILIGLPVLLVFLPYLPSIRIPLLAVGAVVGFWFIRTETLSRAGVDDFNVWDLLDWQFGRFSMVAFAERYVADHGLIGGETLLTGYLTVPSAILHLLRIPNEVPTLSVVQVTGSAFLGTDESIFIVPGMTAELFLNFGYAGVVVGYVILGLVVAVLANLALSTRGEMGRLLVGYLAGVSLVHSVNAQSGAALPIIVFGGFPLFLLTALEFADARRHQRWHSRASNRVGAEARTPSRPAMGATLAQER